MTTIIEEQPPKNLCDRIRAAGMGFDPAKTVFTYDGAIYNPAKLKLPPDLVFHEETHIRQQASMGADAWWDRYLADPLFRIRMEAEAYGRQWAYYCKNKKSRDRQLQMLVTLASLLAGPMYGSMITPEGASKMISEKATLL